MITTFPDGRVPSKNWSEKPGAGQNYYNWRSKYGGMDASLMSEMKSMADENRRLKKMYAELAMQNELLKDALGKK